MMNKPPFLMGQTKQEEFTGAAGPASHPFNFAGSRDVSFHTQTTNNSRSNGNAKSSSRSNSAKHSPCKNTSPLQEQPGRPSTPYPENEVQFVMTGNNPTCPPHPAGSIGIGQMGSATGDVFTASSLSSPTQQAMTHANEIGDFQSGAEARRPFLVQQQSWPPYQNGSPDSSEMNQSPNPFVIGQRAASCDAAPHGISPPSLDREERIPNSAIRRSRVWKYGRRTSGGHGDRQPFTFSIPAGSQAGFSGGARLYGKRTFPNAYDESWSTEPSHKQFISEERMMAEMHNLSINGLPPRNPLFPVSTSPSSSASSSPTSSTFLSSFLHSTDAGSPSTTVPCSHGTVHSDLFRFHQCHQDPRSRAQASLADIERRLDDSDDEGVEEDMPPSQAEGQQRLEMTPQLVSALKAKGSANHVLPEDIVKKIAMSPCMELVLWRPALSPLNPRGGGAESDAPGQSSSAAGASPGSPGVTMGCELPPIMEVELEREDGEGVIPAALASPQTDYNRHPAPVGMQDEALPDFDEDMDL